MSKLEKTVVFALLVALATFTGQCGKTEHSSQRSEEQGAALQQSTDKQSRPEAGSVDRSLADRIFEELEPFDVESYGGMTQSISTLDENTAVIVLYAKKGDQYEKHAALEIKGKIVLGAEGILGYPDTFLRIKFLAGNGGWKEIGRRAINNGRLYIETEGDRQQFTVRELHATQYTGLIESGVQLLSAEQREAETTAQEGSSAPPKAGTYTGTMEDGSSLRIALVQEDNQVQVKEFGYCLFPIHTEVKRVFLEGTETFGEMTGNTLRFQMPVQMPVLPVQLRYYDVELRWDKPSEIHCALTATSNVEDEFLKFQLEDVDWGAYKDASRSASNSLEDHYELILKP
jgi:hypothetical protein